ncbi:hypothetical protein [Vibrio caribbeanicus]|uniref:Uncharacterized protein n=1 Tax=Vibrio caribbeanicus ATCC BAA-2122 TaxID=796620 RepID=E3BPJ6_9VIBR|nr:hypothetical protein [Vibrio caribbeanicus]EFP95085.1 hypothetical protein VIBC2010_04212 [Vibrio caribbeanicus ATCC BAA-2122]
MFKSALYAASLSLAAIAFSSSQANGLFEDLEYPDNRNRLERAEELSFDIKSLTSQLANDKVQIERKLQTANSVVIHAYSSCAQDPHIDLSQLYIGHDWTTEVIDALEPLVIFPLATIAINKASISYLISEGRIGEAAFARLAGLPPWFRVGQVAGGIATVIGGMAITDAVTGAIHRDKLRHIIHEQIQPRIELKRAAMINAAILESLDAIIISFNALTASNALNKQQLDTAVSSIVEAQRQRIDTIVAFDDKRVKQILHQIDVSKHSWTNEDYYFENEDENEINI